MDCPGCRKAEWACTCIPRFRSSTSEVEGVLEARRWLLNGLQGFPDDLAGACNQARKLVSPSSPAHAVLMWVSSANAGWATLRPAARTVGAAVALASLLPAFSVPGGHAQQRRDLASMLDSIAAALRLPTTPAPSLVDAPKGAA